jgi:hypothetical protein
VVAVERVRHRDSSLKRWNGGTVERWNGGTVERWNRGTRTSVILSEAKFLSLRGALRRLA